MEDDTEKATLLVDDILKEKLREVILDMFPVLSNMSACLSLQSDFALADNVQNFAEEEKRVYRLVLIYPFITTE